MEGIFGIGIPEVIFIVLIAIILIGPKDIGKTARSAGRFLNKVYRSETWHTLNEASRNIRNLPNRLAREAALEELDKDIRSTADQVKADLKELDNDVRSTADQLKSDIDRGSDSLQEELRAWSPMENQPTIQPPLIPTPEDQDPSSEKD